MRLPLRTRVYEIGDRYFVVGGKFLQVKGQQLGLLFVAQDIFYEQQMFSSLVQSLGIVSLIAIVIITIAISIYIKKSLQPLRRISQRRENYIFNRFKSTPLALPSRTYRSQRVSPYL